MVGWGAFEKALDRVGAHTNLVGKYWITTFNMLRLLFLLGIANQAWPDGTDLECDTNTPGCEMMCVNHFYPIAPLTFWKLQVLFVCLPTVVFMVFASHMEGKIKFSIKLRQAMRNDSKSAQLKLMKKQKDNINKQRDTVRKRTVNIVNEDEYDMPDGSRKNNVDAIKWLDDEEMKINSQEKEMENMVKKMIEEEKEEDKKALAATGGTSTPPKLLLAYGTMVIFRVLIEIAFLYLYGRLYEFDLAMPEKFWCDQRPCNNVVACYIDRPKQKTFTIVFLVVTMIFTMMLGIVEFASIGIGNYFKAFANRHQDITKGFGLKIQNSYLNNAYK